MRDYQESVITGQTHRRTDRQTPDKVIHMRRYAFQATQNGNLRWLYYLQILLCTTYILTLYTSIHFSHQSVHLIINASVAMVIKRNYCQLYITAKRNFSSFQSCEILLKVRDRSGKNDRDMTSPNTNLLAAFS